MFTPTPIPEITGSEYDRAIDVIELIFNENELFSDDDVGISEFIDVQEGGEHDPLFNLINTQDDDVELARFMEVREGGVVEIDPLDGLFLRQR